MLVRTTRAGNENARTGGYMGVQGSGARGRERHAAPVSPNVGGLRRAASHRLRYRPDLEGLRAVAILLVVAAHAGVSWLAGGFIGVDVFFVLSGYLITGLLLQEVRTTGGVGIAAFYARRFRRLLPALLTMIAVTGVLASLLLTPADQAGQAISAASAAVWLSNFHFAFSELNYFSAGAEGNLSLHTWSLGVEEQFYLLWPLIVVFTTGFGAALARPWRNLRLVMLLIFSTSLLACIVLTPQTPHVAFYMMPTRAWQFALGASAFLWLGGLGVKPDDDASRFRDRAVTWPKLSRVGGWLGVALIAVAAMWFDENMLYPGAWALIPSVGTALVLAAGAQKDDEGANALLSRPPMQAIGRVSYAWYLWHWPILLLGASVWGTGNWLITLGLVALSFLLAKVSYRWVETPIRRGDFATVPVKTVLLTAFACMACISALGFVWNNSALDQAMHPEHAQYLQSRSDVPAIYSLGCDEWYHTADVRICAFGEDDAPRTAVAIGDSIGLQWFPAIHALFDRPGWRLLVITKSACPMVDKPIFYGRIGRYYTECEQWRRLALEQVAAIAPDVVIMGSTASYDFSESEWIGGTTRVLEQISDSVGSIHVLRSTPILPFDGPTCLATADGWLRKALGGAVRCSSSADDARGDMVYHWLQTATTRVPNAAVIDLTDAICPDGTCHAEQNGMVVFRDSQHLTASFAKSLKGVLGKRIGAEKPFLE